MHLEVDMGNTRLKWRLRTGASILARGVEDTGAGFERMASLLETYKNNVKAIWVASVVGNEIEKKFSDWAKQIFSAEVLFAKSRAAAGGVVNGYDLPERLGIDRWLGLLAAHRLTKCPCIVISCGTAITVDLLSGDGVHQGGYIAPGLRLMLDSINSRARLIDVDKESFSINLLPGRSTTSAVFAGLSSMMSGLVENAFKQLSEKNNENIELILVGGDANMLLPLCPNARVIPDLVLDGLACAKGHLFPVEQ